MLWISGEEKLLERKHNGEGAKESHGRKCRQKRKVLLTKNHLGGKRKLERPSACR